MSTPTCPRCGRTDKVRGGYVAYREAQVWCCWFCCHEWETPHDMATDATATMRSAAAFGGGKYYGLPVVSPITGGTLRGYAQGGGLDKPTILTDAATGKPFGVMGLSVTFNASGVDELRDRAFWKRAMDKHWRTLFQKPEDAPE